MGGHKDTKKSFAEVQQDLQDQLLTNAKNQYKTDAGKDADGSWQLEDVLKNLALIRFKKQFGFDYNDDPSKITPPGSLGGVTPLGALCSITNPATGQIQSYIKATVLSKAGALPDWARNNAGSDIATLANSLLSSDTNKQWKYQEYAKTFYASLEDQDSWDVDATLVYVNGSLTEDALDCNLCIIYFLGVFWKIENQGKEIRDRLHRTAYDSAKTTSGFGETISNDQDLGKALLSYSQGLFNAKFGFNFGGTPDDYPKDARQSSITYNGYLSYLPDLDSSNSIPEKVRTEIFGGINIGIDAIKQQAITDVTDRFKSIIKDRSDKSWVVEYIDGTYGINDPGVNPMRNRGIIVYYYDHDATDTSTQISITYIYYMAMFSETYQLQVALARDLLTDLCNDLIQHITKEESKSTDFIALQQYLMDFSKQQFKETFGFEWADGIPPDQIAGKTIRRFFALCNPTQYPPGADEVSKFVNSELFPSNENLPPNTAPSFTFPPYAQANIWHDVVDHLNRYLGTDTVKDASYWYTAHHDTVYNDPNKVGNSIHQRVMYVYCLGEKTENALGGGDLKRPYGYYFAVYNSATPQDGGGW